MKILYIGDLHISRKHYNRSQKIIERLEKLIKPLHYDMAVLGGDVFHDHSKIYCETIPLYEDLLSILLTEGEVLHLLGNHEMPNSVEVLPEQHSLNIFKGRHSRLHIIDEVTYWKGHNILFVPYLPLGGHFKRLTEKYEAYNPLCFAHQEFAGSIMSTQGEPLPPFRTISGHVHTSANIGTVSYPGTPATLEFGDESAKHIWLIDYSPAGGVINIDKIPTGLEYKKTININSLSEINLEAVRKETADMRFVITLTKPEIYSFKKTKEYKELNKYGKVVLKTVTSEIPTESTEKTDFWEIMNDTPNDNCKAMLEEILSEIRTEKL